MILSFPTNKSLHQLPLITKKSNDYSSPKLEKMKTLHITNIRTIKKQQTQSANTLQKYYMNKSQYLQTVCKKNEQNAQSFLRNLENKSVLHVKENAEKQKKHNENYRNFMSQSKDKIKATYLKEKAKLESALKRKEQLDNSRHKEVFIKKPNYRKLFLEQLGKSAQLHKTTIQKLVKAEYRRNQIKHQKQNQMKGKLESSIVYAQSYAINLETQKQKKIVQKSITKMQRSQRLVSEQKETNRSASESSRKIANQKFLKAQQSRNDKQKQTIQKLQQILQQKCKKTQTINQRKTKNLQMFSTSLKKSRSQHLEQAQQRSRSLMIQTQFKNSQFINDNHEKWKFLTGIKDEFDKVKTKNLYESQKVSLRC